MDSQVHLLRVQFHFIQCQFHISFHIHLIWRDPNVDGLSFFAKVHIALEVICPHTIKSAEESNR